MFPRAKLTRFNEVSSCAPPPGAYDPKFEDKVKGFVIEKSDRFVDPKPCGADSNLVKASSLTNLPTFRTPQPPRRFVRKPNSTIKSKFDSSGKVRKRLENELDTKSESGSTPDISKLDSRDREISSLNDLYSATREELQKSTERCHNLEETIKTDKEIIARLEQEEREMKEALERAMEDLANSSNEYKAAVEQCNMLDANLAERKAAVEELEQAKTELLLEIEVLQKRSEQNAEEIEEVSRRCLELESELAESVALNNRLERDRAERSNEVSQLAEQVNALSAEVASKTEQCAALEAGELNLVLEVERKVMSLDEMNKEVKLRDECIYELENNLAACRSELAERVKETEALYCRQQDMENNLGELTADIVDYKERCSALESDRERLNHIVGELEKSKEVLEQCVSSLARDLEAMHAEVSQCNAALEDAQTRVATEQLEKDKLSEEVFILSEQVSRLDRELSQRQLTISGLESDLVNCNKEIEACKAEAEHQLKEFKLEIELIKEAHDRKMAEVNQELERNVAACESRVSQAQAEYECELAKLRNLAYRLEQKVLDEREAQQRLQCVLDEERQIAETEAQEHEKELLSYRSELGEARNVLVNVENSLRELDKVHAETLQRHKEELDEAHRKVAAAEQAVREEQQRAEASINAYIHENEAKIYEIQRASEEAAKEAEQRLGRAEEQYNEKLRHIETATDEVLKRTRAEATVQLEQLKAESELKVREAEAEVSSILMKLSEAEEQLRILNSERDTLRTADLDRQIVMVELQDRVHMMETELAESRRKLVAAVKELDQTRAELEVMKRLRRNLELIGNETLATVNAVSKRLLDREVEVERLTRLNAALEEHYNEQKKNISELELESLRQVENIRMDLLAKLEEFRLKGADEISRLQNRILEMTELIQYYKAEIESANDKLEEREAELSEQNVEMMRMQDSMNDLSGKLDLLAVQYTELIALKESHAKQEEQLKTLNLELDQAKRDAIDAETEIQEREKQIVDLTSNLEEVTGKLRRAEEFRVEAEISAKQVEFLTTAKSDLQSQLDSLNTVLECHKMNALKAAERIEVLTTLADEKESLLELNRNTIQLLNDELHEVQAEVYELKQELNVKENNLWTVEEELATVKEVLEESERKCADLVSEVEFEATIRKDFQQQIADMYDSVASKDRQVQDSKETISKLESEICDKKVVISSMENQLCDASERISILKDESEASLRQMTEAEKVIAVLQVTKTSLEAKVIDLESNVSKHSDLVLEKEEELRAVKDELENERESVKYLKGRIEANHNELNATERAKLALESEIGSLKLQLEMLQMDMEQTIREKDVTLKTNQDEIATLKDQLDSLKLETESSKAASEEKENALQNEISSLKETLEQKENESKEAIQELEKRAHHLEGELGTVTRRKETYKAAVVELQQLVKQNRGHIINLETDLASTRQERDDRSRELSELRETTSAAVDWEQRCNELEKLIGPFRDQLEAFESERRALELRKEAAEGEAKDLATKYAQVLGHQNNKQKIHHVIKLKETIQDLKKENERLESQVRTQKRTIDRLKDDLSRSTGGRFNHSSVFQGRDDSIQGRLSSVINKSNIENNSQSAARNRITLSAVKNKGKENVSELSTNTPASARPIKVKEELVTPGHLSPVRSSPVGSPLTPLKERQNNLN